MEKQSVRTLSFYTTGDGFTGLLHTFIAEGQFKKVYEILKDGKMPLKIIKEFFLLKRGFEGDTREGDLLIIDNKQPKDYHKTLYYAIRMALQDDMGYNEFNEEVDGSSLSLYRYSNERKYKNIQHLFKVIPFSEVVDIIFEYSAEQFGFTIEKDPDSKHISRNGAVLRDGTYITCESQDHKSLYPFLVSMDRASAGDWSDCEWTIHITSGTMSGDVGYDLDRGWRETSLATDEQKQAVFKFRKTIKGIYGGHRTDSTAEVLRQNTNENVKHGGKFNNLTFLKTYYPKINLPKFSKDELEGVKKQCIRTSPKHSLAGLLNSKFDITKDSIKEIKADWKKYKDVREDNELHYFYQEYLEGANGVCHYWAEEKHFTYSVSKNRGDIVKGVTPKDTITAKAKKELSAIAKGLSNDLEESVQLEFVVHNKKVYIVQLRLLKNNHSRFETDVENLSKIIGVGQTFSAGNITVKVKDILIVDADADSDALLGKKALIVKDDVEFSHVLALSKSLSIPSMFNMDTLVLQGVKEVDFIAEGLTSYITKKHK